MNQARTIVANYATWSLNWVTPQSFTAQYSDPMKLSAVLTNDSNIGVSGQTINFKVLTPATLEDARGMLWTALQDPDPVLIFENCNLYNMEGELADNAGAVDIDRARIVCEGRDLSIFTYGGSLWKVIEASTALASDGVSAEVVRMRLARNSRVVADPNARRSASDAVNDRWCSRGTVPEGVKAVMFA